MGAKPGWTTSVDSNGERRWHPPKEENPVLEIAKEINAMRHELTDPGAQERRMERIADRMRDDKHKETLGTELSKALDLASKLEAANTRIASLEEELASTRFNLTGLRNATTARIAELEALVTDQKAATDEEFQNCSKIEAELAEAKARIAELEDHAVLATLAKNNDALRARIAELEQQAEFHVKMLTGGGSAAYLGELAEAKARIAALEAYHTNCTDYINGLLGNMADDDKERVAILARAERAEAELRATAVNCAAAVKLRDQSREQALEYRKCAERAEEQAHYANGVADLAMKHRNSAEAELKAVRELLDWIYGFLAYVDSYHSRMIRDKIRAALAPSPAGREG